VLLAPAVGARVAAAGEETAADFGTGVVTGTVRYAADAARPWRYARAYVQEGRLAEAVVAIEDQGLLANRPADPIRKPVTHVVDQQDFRFVPETTVIRAGDAVTFTNSDEQVHNVFTADLSPFNVNTPPDGEHTRSFPKPGGTATPVRIGCIYHSNMRSWIFVMPDGLNALTGTDGAFRITGVQPGRHRLVVTHPSGRLTRTLDVDVVAGRTTDLGDVTLTPDHLPPSKRESTP
jgi:plastocyanin